MEEMSPLQRALDISTNRIVSACAGAGKTYALSKRYCAIIDEFTKHNLKKPKNEWLGFKNILVITFTNKAAAEMSRRIYEDLQLLLKGKEIGELKEQGISLGESIRSAPEDYKNWLRSTFSQNYIMTIDAFCGSVLRENAFLLDIDPQFKTSDELLEQKLYRETLNEFLNRQSKGLRPELKHILTFTDKNGIIQFFNYFNKRKVFLEEWLEFIENQTEDEIYKYWLQHYLPEFDVNRLVQEVNKITQYHEHIKEKETNSLAELSEKLESMPEDTDVEQRRYFMAEILPHFITNKGTYYKRAWSVQKKSSFIENHIAENFKELAEELLDSIQSHIPEEKVLFYPCDEDKKSIGVFKDLITLYAEFEEVIWQTQKRKNFLTFNDVIIKTRELLAQNENVRNKYAAQFKHILVDEFQDTNNLRWEIVKHIAKKNDGILREKGLFIVGDKKQSIYRFQQADVEVMNIAKNEIEEVTPDALIAFNDNYRSSSSFIEHVINPFFTKILAEPSFTFEASFEETTFPKNRKEVTIDNEYVCDISIIENETSPQEYTPALHVAYMAKEYLEWAEKQKIKENVLVGVLLRNFIHINDYLHAFRKLDIPFQIIGEKNLFNQQETYDLFHFISVLINPHDDAALVGLLRSPFFSAEDTLVYNCRSRKKDESIFSFMSHNREYESFVQTIQQWRELYQRLPANELLQKVLSTSYRELGYISEVGGRQRLANLDKLLYIISQLELEGSSLQELHDYLNYQIHYKSEIAQADIPEPAKVQIMTIHKAKGLQFPTVIIPELANIKTQAEKGNIFHSRLDPNGMIEVGIAIKEQIESKKSNFLELIKKQDKIEQEAEDKRMFYVAVTRTKYRIALLAECTEKFTNNSWWSSYVIPTLGLPKTLEKLSQDDFNAPPKYHYTYMSLTELHDRLVQQLLPKQKTKFWDPPTIQQPDQKYMRITPHDIMSSMDLTNDTEKTDEIITNDSGLIFGSIFHTIIEKHWWKWEEHSSEIKEFIDSNYPLVSCDDLELRIKKHLENFNSSEIYTKLQLIEERNLFHEHHVTGWMDNGKTFFEVNGIIDLMYQDEEGWTIIDFKTDRTAQFHEQYSLQLQTYLWIVKQLYGIDARAYIYYSFFNELREIKFSNDYWSTVFPEAKSLYTPSKLHETISVSNLLQIIKNEPCTIINLTKYHSNKMLQTLAAKKILTPLIEITTLNQLLISSSQKVITPCLSRLLVKQASNAYHLSDGTIDLLAQAFIAYNAHRRNFESGNRMFNEIYQNFEALRVQYHYHYENELLENIFNDELSERTVILNGLFKDGSSLFSLIRDLANHTKKFYFIDNFSDNSLSSAFDYTEQIWESIEPTYNSGQPCTPYHSVETEIEGIAQKIFELKQKNISYPDIQLAISSIDVYVPVVEKVFGAYGIPYRLYAPSTIMDHPLTIFFSGLLTIMLSAERLTWQTLSSVVLHPLMPKHEHFYSIDAFIRKSPLIYFSDVTELSGVQQYRESIHTICEWIAMLELNPEKHEHTDIWNKIYDFLNEQSIVSKLEDDKEFYLVYSALKNIITSTIETYQCIGFPKHDEILRELKRQFRDAEIPRRNTGNGIDVISYLESYESNSTVLFVAGLAEDYFPVPLHKNSFTRNLPHFEWQKSSMLLNSWLSREKHTYLSFPCQNMSGDTLNPSILLEGMDIQNQQSNSYSTPRTLRQYYLTFEDTIIENPNLQILKRHNDYLSEDIGPYKGQVVPDDSDRILISASSMNTLIQCPMQYFFQTILKIKPFQYDPDAELLTALGNNIHKALEKFGNKQGFKILNEDISKACMLLAKLLDEVLLQNNINLESDLFIQRLYSPYTEGLVECNEKNLLVSLLQFDKEKFIHFSPILFEQNFGKHEKSRENSWPIFSVKNEKVTLDFQGMIDKIAKHLEEEKFLASDYKTGIAPSIKDIKQFWDVQPLVYLLALEDHYRNNNILFMYESTRDILKHTNFYIINLQKNNFLIKWKSRDELKEVPVSRDDFLKLLLMYGEKVIDGSFHIREREYNRKPCDYCEYYKICRKNSIITTSKELHDILPMNSKEQ